MKKVKLRVLRDGEILARDGGDDPTCDVLDADTGKLRRRDFYRFQYGKEASKATRLLPFYCLTDREEAALRFGAAFLDVLEAQQAVDTMQARIDALFNEEKSILGRIVTQVRVTDVVKAREVLPENPEVAIALTERMTLEREIADLRGVLGRTEFTVREEMRRAVDALITEMQRPHGARGQLDPELGNNCPKEAP